MGLRAEFTIEPFVEGAPGPHVLAAIEAARVTGVEVEIGPFGTTIVGSTDLVLQAADELTRAAFAKGATRVSLHLTATESSSL